MRRGRPSIYRSASTGMPSLAPGPAGWQGISKGIKQLQKQLPEQAKPKKVKKTSKEEKKEKKAFKPIKRRFREPLQKYVERLAWLKRAY